MKHTPLLTACLLALACQPRTTQAPDAEPSDANQVVPSRLPVPTWPEPAALAVDEIEVVRQLGAGDIDTWRFEPGGKRIAALITAGCGVWQVEDQAFLGLAEGGDQAAPCRDWPLVEPMPWAEPAIKLDHPDGKRQLVALDDRFEVVGMKLKGRARGSARYRAAAFSPDGRKLALLVAQDSEEADIEIWNLDRGRLEDTLGFESAVGRSGEGLPWKHLNFWIAWDDQSLRAVVEIECDEAKLVLAHAWTDLEDNPEQRQFPDPDAEFGDDVVQVYMDHEHRALFVKMTGIIPDDGAIGEEFGGLALADLDDFPTSLGSSWGWRGSPGSEWGGLVGESSWQLSAQDCCYWDEIGWTWSATSITPMPDRSVELTIDSGFGEFNPAQPWDVTMVGRGQLTGETVVDDPKPGEPVEEEGSEDWQGMSAHVRTAPEGCVLVDADWAAESLLLACADRWLIAGLPELGEAVELEGATELARGTGEPRRVVWGPRGLAIWSFAEGLRMFGYDADDELELRVTEAKINELHRALLDEELDRALVRQREGLRVAELDRATLGPSLEWTGKVEFAAFAPEGDRIAIAGGGELAVFSCREGKILGRWSTGTLAGLAFRQDGAVLYVGRDRPLPELALDPTTGELVASAQLDRVAFERIAAAKLDPSWRWALERDGTLLRTLDGQALILGSDSHSGILESGWFEGDPKLFADTRLHVGPGSPAPVHSVEALATQLARPGLIADFLSGRPLPRPHVTLPR